jgi:hypothetical protein
LSEFNTMSSMSSMNTKNLRTDSSAGTLARPRVVILLLAMVAAPAARTSADTLTFTQGVDGYSGGSEIYVARDQMTNGTAPSSKTTDSFSGSEAWIDQDGNTAFGAAVYKFANVFGSGASQVPAGSRIVSATLGLTTGTSAYAGTLGDPRVHGATGPISTAVTFEQLSGLTPAEQGAAGYLYGFGGGPLTAWQSYADGQGNAETIPYDVSGYLRMVSAGVVSAADLALVATNNSLDGWQLWTQNASAAGNRPTLSVEYDTTRQQGVTTLGSDKATIVQLGYQGNNTAELETGGTVSVDGLDATGEPPNDQAIVKFDLASALPDNAVLQQARLVTVTGGGNSQSGDTNNVDAGIAVQQILIDWDLDAADATIPTLPSEFGSVVGIQASESEASSGYVDMNGNLFDGTQIANRGFDALNVGEEFVFDVTGIVENWLDGDANYGFVFTKKGTDGWAFNVDDVQLQLDYTTPVAVPEPGSLSLAAAALAIAAAAGLLRQRR